MPKLDLNAIADRWYEPLYRFALSLAVFTSRTPLPGESKTVASSPRLIDRIAAAMPLEFRHEDTQTVLAWLAGQNAPVPEGVPEAWSDTPAAGCRIFSDANGGRISLICLQVDRQLVHVFIFDSKAAERFDGPQDQWWREDGYHMIARERGEHLFALAARADPGTVAHLL